MRGYSGAEQQEANMFLLIKSPLVAMGYCFTYPEQI